MNIKMVLAAIDGTDMEDCQDCADGNENMLSCDSICVPPIFGMVPSIQTGLSEAKIITTRIITDNLTGHTDLPDPYPPRSITLN
jgi:hypothetical protein